MALLSLSVAGQAAALHQRERPYGAAAPPAAAGISMDQAIAAAERRHKARVVRAETRESAAGRVYVLRLLSEEGRVWSIKVDATTGAEK